LKVIKQVKTTFVAALDITQQRNFSRLHISLCINKVISCVTNSFTATGVEMMMLTIVNIHTHSSQWTQSKSHYVVGVDMMRNLLLK